MADLDENGIIPLVTFVLLVLSELLPFLTNVNGNGVLHTIVEVVAKIVKTNRRQIAVEAQPPVTQPTETASLVGLH